MANPWETDSPNFRGGGSFPWARTLAGLMVVVTATFVLAYYLPLHRAHEALTERHREAAQKSKDAEAKVTQLSSELEAVKRKRDELEAAAARSEGQSKSASERVDSVKSALTDKLQKLVKKGDAAVGAEGTRVVAAIATKALLGGPKNDVTAGGKAILCDVAKAAGNYPLAVGAVGGATTPKTDPWTATATQAAKLAQALEEKCQVSAKRLTAQGHAGNAAHAKAIDGATLPDDRVVIAIATDDG